MKGTAGKDDVLDGFVARPGTWAAGKDDMSNGCDVGTGTWAVCATLDSLVLAPWW